MAIEEDTSPKEPSFKWQAAPEPLCPGAEWQGIDFLPSPDGRATKAMCMACAAVTDFDLTVEGLGAWKPWVEDPMRMRAHQVMTLGLRAIEFVVSPIGEDDERAAILTEAKRLGLV